MFCSCCILLFRVKLIEFAVLLKFQSYYTLQCSAPLIVLEADNDEYYLSSNRTPVQNKLTVSRRLEMSLLNWQTFARKTLSMGDKPTFA